MLQEIEASKLLRNLERFKQNPLVLERIFDEVTDPLPVFFSENLSQAFHGDLNSSLKQAFKERSKLKIQCNIITKGTLFFFFICSFWYV